MTGVSNSKISLWPGLTTLLLLVAVAVGSSLQGVHGRRMLGASACTWGPSYWCQALNTSASCGATAHCISKVWERNPAQEDTDDVCSICKEMVKEARDQLESNETQTELKEVLEGSCDLIPIKIIASECKKLADDFVPELVETLASQMDPTTVCTVARLCNNERIDRLLEEENAKKQQVLSISSVSAMQSVLDDPIKVCTLCSSATKKMKAKVFKQANEQLITSVLALCGEMGSTYADACKMAVVHNSNQLVRSLREMDEQICYEAGLCSEEVSPDPSSIAVVTRTLGTASASMECEFCKSIVEGWLEQFKSNATLEELKQVMDGVCSKLGQPDRIDRCKHIVDDYYIPFIKEVAQNINATTICTFIALCDKDSHLGQLDVTVLVPYDLESSEQTVSPSTPSNRLLGGYFMPQSVAVMETPGCVICKFATHRLKEWLQDGHTVDEISDGLHLMCSTMPASLKVQCDYFADRYAPVIEQLIINGIEVADICNALQLCKDESSEANDNNGLLMEQFEVISFDGDVDNPIVAMKNDNENCATCQYVLHIVLEALEDKDNQDELKNLLEVVCRAMPGKARDRCEAFVEKYVETIINFVAQGFTADEICQAMALCERPRPKGQYCVICEFVIKTLDQMLSNKTNVDEIKKALEQVCAILPKTVSQQCVSFVDTYTDQIIDMLTHSISPELICTGLGLCDKKPGVDMVKVDEGSEEVNDVIRVTANESEETFEDQGPTDDHFCMLCEYFVSEAEAVVGNKTDAAHIENVLDELCDYMSGSIRRDCVDFVHSHADQIAKMFATGASPAKVCAKLRLCPALKGSRSDDRFNVAGTANSALSNDVESATNDISVISDSFDDESRNDVAKLDEDQLCSMCEYAMDVVENQLLGNETLKDIEIAVRNVCLVLPGSIGPDCNAFVTKYGDAIIRKIDQLKVPPKEVCITIGLCSASDVWDATSVGGQPCVWGPALWCASRFHASSCGTLEYCNRMGIEP